MFDRIKSFIGASKPLDPAQLMRDGKLVAPAIEGATAEAGQVVPLLSGPAAPAAAIIAGLRGLPLAEQLVPLLAQEGLAGRAAAWALARLGAEAALLAACAEGPLEQRDNAYWGLAVLAALNKASPQLAAALRARVQAELERARSGGTGLGEHAVRALAVLGDAEAATLAQAVLDGDRYCDRFELQRIKKALADSGRDRETASQLSAPWTQVFADQLASEAASAPPPPPKPEAAPAAAPPAPGAPIDWRAFLASPEAAALPAPVRQFAAQFGPMLEQAALRALGAPLTDLSRDEFATLLMQVLPQALPPQYAQAALSPSALNAFQALAKFLIRTGAATNGDGLLQGVKLVRRTLAEQLRASGVIGGPDYSDPDEKPASPPPPAPRAKP
ncbi:MAG: hypothetical protein RMM29_04565 [Planctomycetota bacterium]|nr:hypothetical protein [Planctomycetota bacterium]MCX8040002.1 hypothetical protein [Planctomycetota bacterium]MDW8372908.1 hypothetical protein [Planctomycetota bacterium]